MVYKIIGHFTDDNFGKIIDKISGKFKSIYVDGTLYIGLSKIEDKDEHWSIIKKAFKPSRDFFITEINEKNIMDEEMTIMEWCRDRLLDLDRQRYEKENQEHLRETWEAMNKLEEDLRRQMIIKSKSLRASIANNNKDDSSQEDEA